jgi:hypothetical protein
MATAYERPVKAVQHSAHSLPPQSPARAEIAMVSSVSGQATVYVGLRDDVAQKNERFTKVMHPLKEMQGTTPVAASVPSPTPVTAAHWLAIEKALWHAAYQQGQIHHESVGRTYSEGRTDEFTQHAIRQTVRIQFASSVECVARRKFYLEVIEVAPRLVDTYVDSFRQRIGLRGEAPFGVERARVRDQLYLQTRTIDDTRERLELHRSYAVLGSSPSELVETALICEGTELDAELLGSFTEGWLHNSGRIAVLFKSTTPVSVRALKAPQNMGKHVFESPIAER